MLEASEVGNKLSKEEFKQSVPPLRVDLVNAQYDLRHADFGVLLRLPLASATSRESTHPHHRDLVRAIADSDADRARRAVHEQIDDALEHLADLHRAVR